MKVHYRAHLESMGKTWKNVSLKYLKHWSISAARSLASTLSLTCDLHFILVCLHSPARLLPYPQPSRKEHAKSWRGRRDRHGEGTPRARSDWNKKGPHCHQGETNTPHPKGGGFGSIACDDLGSPSSFLSVTSLKCICCKESLNFCDEQ